MNSSIKIIKVLMYSYSAIIIFGMITNYLDGGIEDKKDFLRGALRAIFYIILAAKLTSYNKWLWWIVVLFSGFFSITGITSMLMFYIYGGFDMNMISSDFLILGIPALIILFSIFVLMLKKSTRKLFLD